MPRKKEIFLTCTSVWYHSQLDEAAFFEWIDKIPSIKKVSGVGIHLYLDFSTKRIPRRDLRELIALFYRYKVDMKQLQIFLSASNKDWFEDKHAYWHRRVWGVPERKKP